MEISTTIKPVDLRDALVRFWDLSGRKIQRIEKNFDPAKGTPVFTVNGKYTTRGWTEWTQGFQYGSAILQYDATGESEFLEIGRKNTVDKMAPHITHRGVHDHGFNNLSTYGNLLRLMHDGKIPHDEWERNFYKLAIKTSGAVQAMRFSPTSEGGYLYSFNGPHSLFVDTVRSCRILMVSHLLGHALMSENDKRIDLLDRAIQHLLSTAKYSVFYGEGRDAYDVWGRTAHEIIFNTNDGNYRCPNSQQGFSGFTTWTRGLAWAMCGFAEELEFLIQLSTKWTSTAAKDEVMAIMLKAAKATSDFYIDNTSKDGIPYWDTGAPQLHKLGDYTKRDAEPYNEFEPVDSSAAAIGAQGLIRLGNYLQSIGDGSWEKYKAAGLTVVKTLLDSPYLSLDDSHEGLILHSVYHRPNNWDNIPNGRKVPCDESSMWGDYHARELMLLVQREINGGSYPTFYSI